MNISDQLEQLGMDQLDMNETTSTNTENRIMRNVTNILEGSEDEEDPIPAELTHRVTLQRRPHTQMTPTNQGPAQVTKLDPPWEYPWRLTAW